MSDRQPESDPRIFFAAERTFLAWIRTGLALMGFGFVVARFGLFLREIAAVQGASPPMTPSVSGWFGVGLVAIGVLVSGAALASHISTVRRLNRGEPFVGRPSGLGIALAGLMVIAGVLMTAYLIAQSS